MEAPQPINEESAKRNRTLLIIAAVAIVLCCVCVVLAVVGYFGFITIRSVETQVIPEEEFPPVSRQEVMTVPPASDPGEAPSGGLANDILRHDTWQVVASAAVARGCTQPVGADSTIEVLQEPDANGVWLEKWTVACSSGDSYAFEVEYILDATGATFNVRWLP
jgi:hypothetical protein